MEAEASFWFNWHDVELFLYWSTWQVATGSAEVSRYRPEQMGPETSEGQANVKEILPLVCKVESHSAWGEAGEDEGETTTCPPWACSLDP